MTRAGAGWIADASKAEATLGGGGEIWIKGYRSLNARVRVPSNC